MRVILIQNKQRGFLLPAAIFLIVILAGLGAFAVNINSVQQTSAYQDVQAIRAYHLARAGAELSAYYLLQTSPDSTTVLSSCPAAATSALTLDGFTITRTCNTNHTPYYEQGSDHEIGIYTIQSTASYGTANTLNYVERKIEMNLSKCRGTDDTTPYRCS